MTSPNLHPRLWLLLSPTLPIGGFSYSQGIEPAVEAGYLTDAKSAAAWILQLAETTLVNQDLACLARLYAAQADADQYNYWNALLLSCRETRELRDEDLGMGQALKRLAGDLAPELLIPSAPEHTLAGVFALLCNHWAIDLEQALMAYAWMLIENQVAAAVKLVPLGQTDGQKILVAALDSLPAMAARSVAVDDGDIGVSAPGLAILSARHETQAFRLFRS